MKKTVLWLSGVLLALSACASTQIKASWKDPTFSPGAMHKALVMAAVPQSTSQRVMEDAFAANLAKHGVQGIPSYTLSPAEAKLNEDGWKRLITEHGIDTVLVARLVDVKTVEREVPPTTTMVSSPAPSYPVNRQGYAVNNGFIQPAYGNNYYGYYQTSYQMVTTPGYTIKDTVAVAESKLFQVSDGKLLWTGSTHAQILPDQDMGALVRQFANVIVTGIYK